MDFVAPFKIVRYRISVRGKVQGVGFRYHVLRLAEQLKVSGFVENVEKLVCIEIEGREEVVVGFLRSVRNNLPTDCQVASVNFEILALRGERGFTIK